jgi:acetate---CoA ligase (ADP-forming)
VSVGMGGVLTEVARDVVFSTAPVDERSARSMIDRLHSRHVLDGFRGAPPADVEELARIVSVMSRGLAGSGLREIEINPLIWDGQEWVAADWLFAHEA